MVKNKNHNGAEWVEYEAGFGLANWWNVVVLND